MRLRVVTWNLMHGRSLPPAGRDLLTDFAHALAGWEWDVALLQEVPPWWPALLAAELDAAQRLVLTSRNGLLWLRRSIAVRWPDVIKSNGGGANAILIRGWTVAEHRTLRLCRLPERRWLHAVRLQNGDRGGPGAAGGVWVGNLHATVHNAPGAVREARLAAETMLGWAAGAPAVLGGDFNVRSLSLDGFVLAGRFDVDHVFAAGLRPSRSAEELDRGPLSDHAPVLVTFERFVEG